MPHPSRCDVCDAHVEGEWRPVAGGHAGHLYENQGTMRLLVRVRCERHPDPDLVPPER